MRDFATVVSMLLFPAGSKVILDEVLMIGTATETRLGMPRLPGATVEAVIEQQTLAEKVGNLT